MCNLSEGVFEGGETKGEAKIILNLSKKGFTVGQIVDYTDKDVEEAKAIIDKCEFVLV
jgi:hypothetical protein